MYTSCMLKKKCIYMKYLCLLLQKKYSSGLPNLGTQIRCAQNRYISAQTDLKYPHPLASPYIYILGNTDCHSFFRIKIEDICWLLRRKFNYSGGNQDIFLRKIEENWEDFDYFPQMVGRVKETFKLLSWEEKN